MTRTLIIVVATFGMLAFVACGGGGGDDGVGPTTPASGEPAGEPGPDSPTVSITSPTMGVGETGEAVVSVLYTGNPGIAAWTVDIEYTTGTVSVQECEALPNIAVCNPEYSTDTVRLVGAAATGVEGDTVIGRIAFQCDQPGESKLELSIETLADATIGDPQLLLARIEDGTITCS